MHEKQLHLRILNPMRQAIRHFSLLAPGDKVLVAMSGGKDSYGLWWALRHFQRTSPIPFALVAYHLDQGQPGHDCTPIRRYLEDQQAPFEIEYQDTYTRVVEKTEPGKIYCSLCSRFRRAILYKAASRLGCNKVALGHHRDDLIETLLLNLFFTGQIKAMPAKLRSANGPQDLIRPLCYVREEDLAELAVQQQFAIMPCQLCGSQAAQRSYIKGLLQQLSQTMPHLKGNLLASLSNVVPSHLLQADPMDQHIWQQPPHHDEQVQQPPLSADPSAPQARPHPQEKPIPLVQLPKGKANRLDQGASRLVQPSQDLSQPSPL